MTDHKPQEFDIIAIGAGFAGLYAIYRARAIGLSVLCIDRADDIGGTWYWNQYPGARCDVESMDYSFSFSDSLQQEWVWTEKYATQPEILSYINHVADRFDLRKDIRLGRTVTECAFDEAARRWTVATDAEESYIAQHLIMATGCLSAANMPDIPGRESFRGRTLHTARWPHEGVDFAGRRVGVIGTGSSGVQAIPILAESAEHLTVFQRTPSFSQPALNRPLDAEEVRQRKENYRAYRQQARYSRNGIPAERPTQRARSVTERERRAAYEEAWNSGKFARLENTFTDIMNDKVANDTVADFVREKISEKVADPETAETLKPYVPYATKRTCMDTGYYETYNRRNVALVDVHKNPIEQVTPSGLRTSAGTYNFDDLVFATGFDAMTGAITRINITGRESRRLTSEWSEGPYTYLGLCTAGFPNLFFITGPGSPSVLSNMIVSIEQHVEWVFDLIAYMQENRLEAVEATRASQEMWVRHVNELADNTLYPQANSWYLGANIPGKKRVFMPYVGGVDKYRRCCEEVARDGYRGFEFYP